MQAKLLEYYSKIKPFVIRYKWILLAVVPVFILLLIVAFSQPNSSSKDLPRQVTPTQTAIEPNSETFVPTIKEDLHEIGASEIHGHIELYENSPELQKREELPNNMVKYTMKSDVDNRPHIYIVRGEEQNDVFNRSISTPGALPPLQDYLDAYGEPETILRGSRFWGTDAQWYLYADRSTAFVINSEKRILEVHTFTNLTESEYREQYGEDIIEQ